GHAGAVPDVVAHVVGDDARVPRVVLGDPGFDLTDKVRPDVGALRVDTATDPREEAHERGPEQDPDHVEDVAAEGPVEPDELEEREACHRHPSDAAAPERVAHRRSEVTLHGVRGGPDVGPDADE